MTPGTDQLVVRQHERLTCRLAGTLRVAEEHARHVMLARSVGDGNGTLNVNIVDCSRGGLGLDSPMFMPRACRVQVRLTAPSNDGSADVHDLEFTAKVQRIAMTSRTPTYYIGLAFIPEGSDHAAKVERLMTFVRVNARRPAAAPLTASTAAVATEPPAPPERRAG